MGGGKVKQWSFDFEKTLIGCFFIHSFAIRMCLGFGLIWILADVFNSSTSSIIPFLHLDIIFVTTSFKKPISTARLFCFMVWRRDLLPKRGACKLLRMLRLGELKVEMQVMKDDMKAEIFY